MSDMLTATPSRSALALTNKTRQRPAHNSPARLRPGALLRSDAGVQFRFAKDGTRVHFDRAAGKRNVIRISADDGLQAILPARVASILLSLIVKHSTDTTTIRSWRLHRVEPDAFLLRLEIRGVGDRKVTIPHLPESGDHFTGSREALDARRGRMIRLHDTARTIHDSARELWAAGDALTLEK